MSLDFNLIEKAGVTQEQFGALVGVSRITVNTWARGRFSPRPSTRLKVRRALDLLKDAVNSGELPVDENLRSAVIETRLKAIAKTLGKKKG